MKLFYAPGACSFGPHLALREAGLEFELEKVDLRAKITASGGDFRAINPNGYVPALQLDNGEVLTEGVAILQYIADQRPRRHLAPKAGTMERYRLQEMLTFISSELHKGAFSPIFRATSPEAKAEAITKLEPRMAFVDKKLEGREFLVGDEFTVADIYFCVILNWCRRVGVDISKWPNIAAYDQRLSKRPKVKATRKAEGLA